MSASIGEDGKEPELLVEMNHDLSSLWCCSLDQLRGLHHRWILDKDTCDQWFGISSNGAQVHISKDLDEVQSKLVYVSQILAMQDYRCVGISNLSFHDRVIEGNIRSLWMECPFQDTTVGSCSSSSSSLCSFLSSGSSPPFGERFRFALGNPKTLRDLQNVCQVLGSSSRAIRQYTFSGFYDYVTKKVAALEVRNDQKSRRQLLFCNQGALDSLCEKMQGLDSLCEQSRLQLQEAASSMQQCLQGVERQQRAAEDLSAYLVLFQGFKESLELRMLAERELENIELHMERSNVQLSQSHARVSEARSELSRLEGEAEAARQMLARCIEMKTACSVELNAALLSHRQDLQGMKDWEEKRVSLLNRLAQGVFSFSFRCTFFLLPFFWFVYTLTIRNNIFCTIVFFRKDERCR